MDRRQARVIRHMLNSLKANLAYTEQYLKKVEKMLEDVESVEGG